MAVSGTAYDPKGFSFLVAEQDDYGTINPNSSGSPDNAYIALDVDSIGSPNLAINQTLDVRSGSRVLQATDFFQDKLASVKEISVSGTATTEGLDLLLSNLTGTASAPFSIASNVATSSLSTGTTNQTGQQLLSIVMKSAYGTTADIAFMDCFCTSLQLSGDAGTEGGRIKFSATFKSGSAVDPAFATTTIDTAITANNYYMSAWDADDRIICGVANAVVSSFSLDIINDVVFSGLTPAGYEVATRSGEVSSTATFSVVYDNNFKGLFNTFDDQTTGASQGATLMATDDTPSNGEFEFKMANSVLTDVSFNEGSVMMLDVSVKAVGAGIGSGTALIEVSC
tara:strand:+ start:5324 stop:6343 length:1020 start_codon:yes stop_codon:yes gene_type:complete